MKKTCLSLVSAFFLFISSLAQTVVVTGADATTVAGNPYTTLRAAFTSINNSTQAGNVIIITVTGTTVEPASATLNQSIGRWTSLRIFPVGTSAITGNITGPLIDLSGADSVSIEGAANSLTINNSNNSALACTIRFVNDARSNTITNCNLLGASGSAVSSGLGTIYFSSGLANGNDNNTITQCNITSSAGGNPINAIFSIGSSAIIDNSNNTISYNNFSDYFNPTVTSCGLNISAFNSAWTITNNTFYQTATRIAIVGNLYYGIYINSGISYFITNNVIGFAAPDATGTTKLIGVSSGSLGGSFPVLFTNFTAVANAMRFVGINCSFTAGGAVSTIENNTIGGIALYTASNAATGTGALCGIAVNSGAAYIGTNNGNIIGSVSGTSSIYVASTSAGAVVTGIYVSSSNTVNVLYNRIGAIDVSGTSATTAGGFTGIDMSSAGTGIFTNFGFNTIGNSTPNNIRTGFFLLLGSFLSNDAATTPTAATGSSAFTGILHSFSTASYIDVYSNLLQGFLISGSATSFTGIANTDSPNGVSIRNNTLGSVAAGLLTIAVANTGAITGIRNNNATTIGGVYIAYNTMQGISCVSSGNFTCINNSGPVTGSIDIINNQFGTAFSDLITYSGVMTNTVREIYNTSGTSTCVLTIQGNSIRGITHTLGATGSHVYISNTAGGLASVNIVSNGFFNLNINTTGNITFIADAGFLGATGTSSCSNNSVGPFIKSGASGNIYFYTSGGNNANGSTMTENGNSFSNITMSGTGTIYGWQNQAGISSSNGPTRIINGNTFSNITGGSGVIYAMYLDYGGPTTCSSNTISNITGTGSITGIYYGSNNGQGTHTMSSNVISSLSSTGTGGNVYGIFGGSSSVPILNINNTSVGGFSSTGASSFIEGIRINAGATVNINDNFTGNFNASGVISPQVAGIIVSNSPTTVNIYRNSVTALQVSAAITSGSPSVFGLEFIGGVTVNAYNNFIAGLTAPAINSTDAIQAIRVDNSTAFSTHNVIYNSVYINASSTGTNFGTSGIYQKTNSTATTGALNLIDNIIVNTSTPGGSGLTAVHRRSGSVLNNYAATSDHNLFYAGTPSATMLIYHDGTNSDQTLAAYQTRVSTRDANSISLMPIFTSTTNLHLTTANCGIDGKGKPTAITTDIDVVTRNVTAPDIGADEFTATYNNTLAGVAGTAVCDSKIVMASPAVTTYAISSCDLIAKVLPSGANPVAGKINVCVTKDASQLYFNGEPYVQRHYDLEPVTSNQTTTSATITLYFTNAEFALYNTNNPVWPPLPTIASGGNASPYITNVKVTQFHGAPTGGLPTSTPGNYTGLRVLLTPVSVVLTSGIWAVTVNVAGFSGFYVHTNTWNAPLPVSVNYFTGTKQGSNHLLNWKVTCNSTPGVTITLERNADSRNFSGINTITADAVRCNQPFNYTDTDPLKGMNYYRLKMVDVDGKISYSGMLALLNAVKGFDIISIAPNPVVDDNFTLNVASAQSSKMELLIIDMQGRLVIRQSIPVIAGFNSLPVNVAKLAAGTYAISAVIGDDRSRTIRFVKQ